MVLEPARLSYAGRQILEHFSDIGTETDANPQRIFGNKQLSKELSAFRGGAEHAPSLAYMYRPSRGYKLDDLARVLFDFSGIKRQSQSPLTTLAQLSEARFFRHSIVEVSGKKYYVRARTDVNSLEHGPKHALTLDFVPHSLQAKSTEGPLGEKIRARIELTYVAPEIGPIRKGLEIHLHFRPGDHAEDFPGLVHLLFSKDYVIE